MDYHLSQSVSKFILLLEISRCKDKPAVMESLSETQGCILQYICEVSCQELLSSSLLPNSPCPLQVLSERAALLVALTIATYLNRMNRTTESVIAVTGGTDHCTKSLWRRSEETVHCREFCSDYFQSKMCTMRLSYQ